MPAPQPSHTIPANRAAVKGATAIIIAAFALAAALYLTGCAARAPRALPVPAPATPAVNALVTPTNASPAASAPAPTAAPAK